MLQAFLTTTEGAIMKAATTSSPASTRWQIAKKGWGNSWQVIGQMQRQPNSSDLELAFYNASAAESPLTAGIKAVKQLLPSKTK
jgi:hypothetical protein